MHNISPDCPIECLTPLLSQETSAALAVGLQGTPATVGQVIELYQLGRLKDIRNISTGRSGEISWRLAESGLIRPGDSTATGSEERRRDINRATIKKAYQEMTDAIAARIAAGQYSGKLPSELDLAKEFGVSITTVRHAMAILRERGLIVSIHGRGTFVAPVHVGSGSSSA